MSLTRKEQTMKLKCFESTDSNGTENYLIPLGDGSFIAVPKERIEHSIDIVRCKADARSVGGANLTVINNLNVTHLDLVDLNFPMTSAHTEKERASDEQVCNSNIYRMLDRGVHLLSHRIYGWQNTR